MVVDNMREGCMVRDKAEKHLSEEIIFDAEHFRQVTLDRLQGHVLLGFALFLLSILTEFLQIDITQSIE